jgi:hypothetical protein
MVSKKLPIKLPHHALTNVELLRYVKILNIPNFRGIFMRNGLPKRIKSKETGIINLDDKNGPGTHWTAYIKLKSEILYFDSMGNLLPPREVIHYVGQVATDPRAKV